MKKETKEKKIFHMKGAKNVKTLNHFSPKPKAQKEKEGPVLLPVF